MGGSWWGMRFGGDGVGEVVVVKLVTGGCLERGYIAGLAHGQRYKGVPVGGNTPGRANTHI